MKNPITRHMLILLIAGASVLAAGCGGDNPVAPSAPAPDPGEEEIVIKIPTKMKITKTTMWKYPIYSPGGGDWDNGITAVNRRPDTFFRLGNYKTAVQVNHAYGTYWHFAWDGGFARMNYAGTYKLELYDDDDGALQGADDHMSTTTIVPSGLYRHDNAKTFYYQFTYGTTELSIEGEWIY